MRAELEKVLSRLGGDVADRLRRGEPVTDAELSAAFSNVLEPTLVDIATGEAVRQGAIVGVAFDEAVLNAEAITWARGYGYDLVSGLTETTQKIVSEATQTFFTTPGMTKGELEALLEPAFGARRAELIATTEVTRAFSAGQEQYQRALAAEGIDMERVWVTQGDETVCPLCGPLNGKAEDKWDAGPPPRHVSCRCSTVLRLREPKVAGEEAMPWQQPFDPDRAISKAETARVERAFRQRQNVKAPDVRADAKDKVVRDLASRVRSSGNADAIENIWRSETLGMPVGRYPTDLENAIDRLVQSWAGSSGDNNAVSLAVQRAAQVEFKLAGAFDSSTLISQSGVAGRVDTIFAAHERGLRAFVRAEYEATQEWLAANNIKWVKGYRGVGFYNREHMPSAILDAAKLGETVEIEFPWRLQPISSFSFNQATALGFAGGNIEGQIWANIPAARILSTARTGIGCLEEWEFTVLGGDNLRCLTGIRWRFRFAGE